MAYGPEANDLEELAERIVEKRWTQLDEIIKGVIEWQVQAGARLDLVSDDLNKISKGFNQFSEDIENRIEKSERAFSVLSVNLIAMGSVLTNIVPEIERNVAFLKRRAPALSPQSKK